MIIPEDTPQSPKAQAAAAAQQNSAEEQSQPSPPAYSAASSTQPLFSPPGSGHPYHPHHHHTVVNYGTVPSSPGEPIVYAEPAGKRFFKAFAIAVLIWMLLAALTGSITEAGRHAGEALKENQDSATAWPLPKDGKALRCLKGELVWQRDSGDAYSISLELPRTSDVLYMFTRGIQTSGNVVITQDDRAHETDTVHVDIVAQHMTPIWLHVFAVCMLERTPGEQGIGIFTPTRWRSKGRLPTFEFEVTIRLPKLSTGQLLDIAALETDLPNFTHHVGDLLGAVHFDSLSLHAANGHIFSQGVNATRGTFKTSNAHIKGHYESHGNLTLQTSNADVAVDVSMYNHDPQIDNALHLQTSNGKIDSSVNLFSTAASGTGGSFAVGSKSANGRIALELPVLPVEARLVLSANTSNAPVQVRVADTYEGAFELRTLNGRTDVEIVRGQDPAGQGRQSVVWETGSSTHRKGGVEWRAPAMGKEGGSEADAASVDGRIYIRTSNANAALYA